MAAIDATYLPEQDALELQGQEESAQKDYESTLVSPFDIDFILFFLLAVLADALDIVLELLGVLIVPKLIGIVIDILSLSIVWWIRWRTGRIVDAQTHRETMKEQYSTKLRGSSEHAKSQIQNARNPLRRFWLRMSFVFLLELIPFVGLLPMWTITVLGTLRRK
jgi:hypothetical protein